MSKFTTDTFVETVFSIERTEFTQDSSEYEAKEYIKDNSFCLHESMSEIETKKNEARAEAERIISDALKAAEAIKSQAKEQGFQEGYELGKQTGHDEGYNLGHQEGHNEAKQIVLKESEELLNSLRDVLDDVENKKETIISEYKEDIVSLALSIARKVIVREVELDQYVINRIIESSIDDFENVSWIKIHGNESIIENKIKIDNNLLTILKNKSNSIKFEISPYMKNDQVLIETEDEVIDLSIDTQIENIERTLVAQAME